MTKGGIFLLCLGLYFATGLALLVRAIIKTRATPESVWVAILSVVAWPWFWNDLFDPKNAR